MSHSSALLLLLSMPGFIMYSMHGSVSPNWYSPHSDVYNQLQLSLLPSNVIHWFSKYLTLEKSCTIGMLMALPNTYASIVLTGVSPCSLYAYTVYEQRPSRLMFASVNVVCAKFSATVLLSGLRITLYRTLSGEKQPLLNPFVGASHDRVADSHPLPTVNVMFETSPGLSLPINALARALPPLPWLFKAYIV